MATPPTVMRVQPFEARVQALIARLDALQIGLYGEACCHLDPPSVLAAPNVYMIGVECEGALVGIGAIKLQIGYAEIKRMFVDDAFRGRGFADLIIGELENHARTNGYGDILLETGQKQGAAIAFYARHHYSLCEPFGSYETNHVSVFMKKRLTTAPT